MENRQLCSIVVPTFRRPQQLSRCLEALARLDYPPSRYEVIVVDDGGGGGDLAPALGLLRARVETTLVERRRGGPAAARNAGAERAGGELLAFTDDDCRPRPDWLALLAASHREHPGEAIGGRTVNAAADRLCSEAAQLVVDVGYAHQNEGPGGARFFATNNLAVPAEGFRDVGGFDPAFRTSEDREFCSRWLASGRRLRHERRAVVEHAHPLGLVEFCRVHAGYGRGAFRFHRLERGRDPGHATIEPHFYLDLARAPFRRERGLRALALLGLMGVWHASNTAGFVLEWTATAAGRRRVRGNAPR